MSRMTPLLAVFAATSMFLATGASQFGQASPPENHANATVVSQLKVATYNVHHVNGADLGGEDGVLGWNARKSKVVELIDDNRPDVLALQEIRTDLPSSPNESAADYFTRTLTHERSQGYTYGAVNPPVVSDDAVNIRPKLIFYRADKFSLVSNGVVPFEPVDPAHCQTDGGSSGWADIRDKTTGQRYFIVNSHFTASVKSCPKPYTDAQREAEAQQVQTLINDFNKWPDGNHRDPIVVMGDLNTHALSPAKTLDILDWGRVDSDGNKTGHSWNLDTIPPLYIDTDGTSNAYWRQGEVSTAQAPRVDYVWYSAGYDPQINGVVDDSSITRSTDRSKKSMSGLALPAYTPSDHYLVTATFNVIKCNKGRSCF